jgi:hypothetical protein
VGRVIIEKRIGPHLWTFEEPDIFIARFNGDLAPDHVRALTRTQKEHAPHLSYILYVVDHARIGETSPEARRVFREEGQSDLPSATAIIGSSFKLRVLADLAFRAVNFFRRSPVHFRFFDDEAAARAWLDEMRPVLQRVAA